MPPPVVYKGVNGSADTEGGIFAGKSFFITQRTPTRTAYVSDVEANGGRVVKLEVQADYLIADHLRKDVPPGSLSYRFIEDAIKEGGLPDDTSPYEIVHARQAQSSAGTYGNKPTRTPFTTEDDRLLYEWVHNASSKGIGTSGNEIYKQLEQHNNRHTSHSWRDRWLKVVSKKPPPSSAPLPASSRTLPASSRAGPSDPHRRFRAIDSSSRSTARVSFTAEDDQFLLEHVKALDKQGYKDKGLDMFKEIAKINSRHTPQSWRDRYVKYLANSIDDDDIRSISVPFFEPLQPPDSLPKNLAPVQPTKTPFTDEDDKFLRKSVRALLVKNSTYTTKQDGVFKELERQNNRHTAQSWKDRWSQVFEESEDFIVDDDYPALPNEPTALAPVLSTSPPPAGTSKNTNSKVAKNNQANNSVPRTQPNPLQPGPKAISPTSSGYTPQGVQTDLGNDEVQGPEDPEATFTDDDYQELLSVAHDIQNIRVGRYHEAWVQWATANPAHTADEWRSYYETVVLPVFLGKEEDTEFWKKNKAKKEKRRFWKTQGQPILVLPYEKRVPSLAGEEMYAPAGDSASLAAKLQTDMVVAPPELGLEAEKQAIEVLSPSKEPTDVPEVQIDQPEEAPEVRFAPRPVSHPERPLLEELQAINQYYGSYSGPSKRKVGESADQVDQTLKRRCTGESIAKDATIQDLPRSKDGEIEVVNISSASASPSYQGSDIDEDGPAQQLLREIQSSGNRPQLTKENLARAQAEHVTPTGRRGVDLVEDHVDDDQEDLIGFLSGVVKEKIPQPTASSNARGIDLAEDDEDESQDDMIKFLSGVVKEQLPEKAAVVSTNNKQTKSESNNSVIRQPQIPRVVQTHPIDPEPDMSSPVLHPMTEGLAPLDPDHSPLQGSTSQRSPLDYASDIELDLVEPEGGWGPSSAPSLTVPKNNGGAMTTQQILDQETQLDLDIPDIESQTSAADVPDSQKLSEDEISGYLEARFEKGYTDVQISDALMATCMNPKLADWVLESGGNAEGRGIWTAEDDKWVEAGDARKLVELEKKHGWSGVQRRLKFKAECREDAMEG